MSGLSILCHSLWLDKLGWDRYANASCSVCRFSDLVTSKEGKELGTQVWNELLGVLKEDVPQVEELAKAVS